MKQENIIQTKSYEFALEIINVYQRLQLDTKEYILSKQLLRSGTSIGANIEEAIGAQSKKDFIAKLSISYKEAREAHYWLRLLTDSKYLEINSSKTLIARVEEILKIIGSILKTMKKN